MCVQDCGRPWYVENYIAFFTAIRAKHPHMRLVSNCDMGDHAPTDIFDWHLYTDSQNMFDRRHEFDNIPNILDKQVFASEYAVFDDPAGHPIPFPGNAKVTQHQADRLYLCDEWQECVLCIACSFPESML